MERGVSEKNCERSVQVGRWAWPGGARCGRCGRRGDAPLSCCSSIGLWASDREEDWVRDFAENERQDKSGSFRPLRAPPLETTTTTLDRQHGPRAAAIPSQTSPIRCSTAETCHIGRQHLAGAVRLLRDSSCCGEALSTPPPATTTIFQIPGRRAGTGHRRMSLPPPRGVGCHRLLLLPTPRGTPPLRPAGGMPA